MKSLLALALGFALMIGPLALVIALFGSSPDPATAFLGMILSALGLWLTGAVIPEHWWDEG